MSILLMSGGVDSAAVLHDHAHDISECLFIDYGQPCAREEGGASRVICTMYDKPLHKVVLPLLGGRAMGGARNASVVAMRNAAMLSVAVNHAAAKSYEAVYCGAILDDEVDYPDCRPDFVKAMNGLSVPFGVVIRAPLLSARKQEVMRSLPGEVLKVAWSCYRPTKSFTPCGECNSCKLRLGHDR